VVEGQERKEIDRIKLRAEREEDGRVLKNSGSRTRTEGNRQNKIKSRAGGRRESFEEQWFKDKNGRKSTE
jgi:hypothetical protein